MYVSNNAFNQIHIYSVFLRKCDLKVSQNRFYEIHDIANDSKTGRKENVKLCTEMGWSDI